MLDLLKAIVDLNGFAEARVQSVLDPLCAGLLEVKRKGGYPANIYTGLYASNLLICITYYDLI